VFEKRGKAFAVSCHTHCHFELRNELGSLPIGGLMMIASKLFQSSLAFAIIFAIAQTSYGVLIAHYPLNELNGTSTNSTVFDVSGDSRNGQILVDAPSVTGPTQGVASVNAGLYGTAYNFDATLTHQVDVNPLSGGLLTPTGAFTYAAWIKPDAADNQTHATPTIIGTNGRGYILQIVQSGLDWDLVLAPGAGTSSALTSPGPTKIKTGDWTHVAITKGANDSVTNLSSVNFYINGVNVGSGR
jgi:hypothetical protein